MLEQLDLFAEQRFHILDYEHLHIIELFAGIGSQYLACKKLGLDCDAFPVEVDKYAIAGYNAIHGTDHPTRDITQIHGEDLNVHDKSKICYLLTYSFPCQALSLAGKQEGMVEGSGTTSSLLWEVKRILTELYEMGNGVSNHLPQLLLMENVPQVHSQKNMYDFQRWISFLKSLGYSNFYQDLNAADYGIPQNRNRCFMVSILGDYSYRFPRKIPLKYVMKHFLEKEVDEKYYLSDAMVEFFVANNEKQKEKGNGFRFDPASRERESKNHNNECWEQNG